MEAKYLSVSLHSAHPSRVERNPAAEQGKRSLKGRRDEGGGGSGGGQSRRGVEQPIV